MRHNAKYAVVLVTAPDVETARMLAGTALKARLIACANLVPQIESHYRWRGKIEAAAEVLLIMKTSVTGLTALEKLIVARHPYTTPEFLVLPILRGTRRYLDWVQSSVKAPIRRHSSKLAP
ncbi:MAG TPA: divalent-cation tolerance protein CutA [Candidatus Paceibacterota bacterium]|nr:divalent-cation tolerance protein CutA [Verrucomicrobiota bacterium]HSA11991.1 divalent-cation tolerance protein CutA [Candidatus Paceibacterota bacterium]